MSLILLICHDLRYGSGGWVLFFILGSNFGGVGPEMGLRKGGEVGEVRIGPGAARAILWHVPSYWYMKPGSFFLFLQSGLLRIMRVFALRITSVPQPSTVTIVCALAEKLYLFASAAAGFQVPRLRRNRNMGR